MLKEYTLIAHHGGEYNATDCGQRICCEYDEQSTHTS